MLDKMIRAARLDVPLYNQVEGDLNETTNALIVVIIVAIASGIGALGMGTGIGGIISSLLGAFIGWAAWAFVIYLVGTRVFNATATVGEVLRTTGYAQSPGVLAVLGIIPGIGPIITFVVSIWTLVTSFIATREALDLDNTKTAITVILGLVAFIVVATILGVIFGVSAAILGGVTGGR